MKITIIHGQNHQGSTYHLAHMIADRTGGEITEFFLPKDFEGICVGCTTCILRDEHKCPHYDRLEPVTKALDEADVIILASPVYVYHCTGQMKMFLDQYGYRWMIHRPRQAMFTKQAVCVSTAAGAGTASTNKDMADSLFFWGVPKIYKYGINIHSMSWTRVNDKVKSKMEYKSARIARRLAKNYGKVRPGLKTRIYFEVMRMIQKKAGLCETDLNYWHERGWDGSNRPWKK